MLKVKVIIFKEYVYLKASMHYKKVKWSSVPFFFLILYFFQGVIPVCQ
jgi:hypothetical protein